MCLRVADDGPGIPLEKRSYVFDPFFSQKAGGIGLGLGNVKKIVEAHGGRVFVSERSPKGGRFHDAAAPEMSEPMKPKVCIIDDQSSILESMEMFFRLRNWEVYTATNGLDGLALVDKFRPALLILDIRLPGMSGLEVLQRLREKFPKLPVIVITAYQDMESTIQAIKLGAFDYLHKPIDVAEMDTVIRRLEQTTQAHYQNESEALIPAAAQFGPQPLIIARSRKMKEVFKVIALVSESRVTVLIQGESGTGKELIARSIHHNSPWKDRPFTVMDCSTLVDSLVESELFGYEKGAFTGAHETKKGRLELTGEGTIFFDEIGELPLTHAGETFTVSAIGRVRAGRRESASFFESQNRGGHQSRSHQIGSGRQISGRPLLSVEGGDDQCTAVTQSEVGYSGFSRFFSQENGRTKRFQTKTAFTGGIRAIDAV